MSKNTHKTDPRLALLRAVLPQRMSALDHTQEQAAQKAGVTQADVSRVLSGQKRRFTPPIAKLCQYAEIDPTSLGDPQRAHDRLSQSVSWAIGDNPAAALVLSYIVDSIAPLIRALPTSDLPTLQEHAHDHKRA